MQTDEKEESAPDEEDKPEASGTSADSPVWKVEYHRNFFQKDAEEDGSVSEWMEGLFIAHNWSENGKKIESMPELVEVDGKTYQLESSQIRKLYTEFTRRDLDWMRKNDGIAFQTCQPNERILLTHYEPVEEGDGYGYEFTAYPYVESDEEEQ